MAGRNLSEPAALCTAHLTSVLWPGWACSDFHLSKSDQSKALLSPPSFDASAPRFQKNSLVLADAHWGRAGLIIWVSGLVNILQVGCL